MGPTCPFCGWARRMSYIINTRGSYLFFPKPVIAACLAVVFLKQGLTAWQLLAMIVICTSVAVEAYWRVLHRPRTA